MVLRRLGIRQLAFHTWTAFSEWLKLRIPRCSRLLKCLVSQATIYNIWVSRNRRLHDNNNSTPAQVFKIIDRQVRDTILGHRQQQKFSNLMQHWLAFEANSRNAEKDAAPNLTVRGFGFIEAIKAVLEAQCPGIVSCADIIALASRDAIVFTGGPNWSVPTGRRDGRISNASEALANIPPPTSNFTNLQTLFANQGLDLKDLVLLSGAHTIGVSHCSSFTNRLYNFTGRGDQDPALDSEYAANLKSRKCPSLNDNTTIVEMDPGSRKTFDLSYYQLLLKRRGLFQSDSALTTNPTTLSNINQILKGSVEGFFSEFAKSMEKMSRINVKTGSAGVVRKQCSVANS
ncbi:Peroxidase 3 [Raphanus sativus]|nr:Peroxidase 3 [Raphanus sativus]